MLQLLALVFLFIGVRGLLGFDIDSVSGLRKHLEMRRRRFMSVAVDADVGFELVVDIDL